jgi:hypothetical protein
MRAIKICAAFFFIFTCTLSFNVDAKDNSSTIKIPCSQLKGLPYYTQYLISTPKASSGWKCIAFVEKGTLREVKAYQWSQKGHATISLVGVPMELITPLPKDMKGLIDDPKEPQPKLSIRNFINVFSANDKYVINDARNHLVNEYFSDPKAVFFSRANAIVGVYYDDLDPISSNVALDNGKGQHQRLLLFRNSEGHGDMFLAVKCDDCFFNDIFNLVVENIFNAPVPEIVFPKSGK